MIPDGRLLSSQGLSYWREVLNTAAVKERARELGGESSPYHAGVMQGVALAIAFFTNEMTDSLVANARSRARAIFHGQDWRRECELYDNLVRRFG